MIVLPTRSGFERRRDRLYAHLYSILQSANVHQVENIMRRIHTINLRLRSYFKYEDIGRQPQELFIEPEDNDTTTQDTATCEVAPTAEELAKIEAQIQTGEI